MNESLHMPWEVSVASVYAFDRMLERNYVRLDVKNIQACMTACAWLMGKYYQDVYVVDVDDYLYCTDYSVKTRELVSHEKTLLRLLDYRIVTPLSLLILQRYKTKSAYAGSKNVSPRRQAMGKGPPSAQRAIQYGPLHPLACAIRTGILRLETG